MSNKKRLVIAACALMLIMAIIPIFATYATNRSATVTIDGYQVYFPDQGPMMLNNRVLVPVRGVFEHMGFYVTWNNEERFARLEREDTVVIIPAGMSSFIVNNDVITPDVPQQMVNNRMLLPLRAIAEALGGTAEWDNSNRIAQISSPVIQEPTPEPPPPPEPTPEPYPEEPEPTPYSTPEPTPEPGYEEQNQERDPTLIGVWYWQDTVFYYFAYNGYGTMAGTDITWSTYNGRLRICVTPYECGQYCYDLAEWYYNVYNYELTLTSIAINDITFVYTRSPGETIAPTPAPEPTPTPEPTPPPNQEHNPALIGTWYLITVPYYVFEYYGYGKMGTLDIFWSTYNGRIRICATPFICGRDCIAPTEWYYNINDGELTLTSADVQGVYITLTNQPYSWQLPTPTPQPSPTPTPPPGGNPQHAPFLYTRSNIQLPNRRQTNYEREEWINEYNNNGGPSAFELEVVRLVNNAREEHGLNRLYINNDMMMASRFYAQTITNLDLSPFGTNPQRGPYHGPMGTSASFGAVVEWWTDSNLNGGGLTAEGIVNSWMRSQGHRNYILHPNHMYIGFGSHLGGRFNVFHSLLLSIPTPNSPIRDPFQYTTSNFRLTDRELNASERAAWVDEYNNNGGASAFENAIINMVNDVRANYGLNRLYIDNRLMHTTRFYVQNRANLEHTPGPNPPPPPPFRNSIELAQTFGITIVGQDGGLTRRGGWYTEVVFNQWMNTPEGRNYILYPGHRYIGFGSHLGGRSGVIHYLLMSN